MKTKLREHLTLEKTVALLNEQGFEVTYKTVYKWVTQKPPLLPSTRIGKRHYVLKLDLSTVLHQNGNQLYRKMESLPE